MKTPDEIKNGLNHCSEDGCKQCLYKYDCDMADGFSVLAGDALAYIHQLEHHIGELTEKVAQLEAAQPKWISVDERLPDDHGNFITKIHCDIGDWIEVNTFDHTEKEWWHDAGNRTEEATEFVTHWLPIPIPEPPKEDA